MADEEGGQLFLVSTGTTQFLQFRELLLVEKTDHKQELLLPLSANAIDSSLAQVFDGIRRVEGIR